LFKIKLQNTLFVKNLRSNKSSCQNKKQTKKGLIKLNKIQFNFFENPLKDFQYLIKIHKNKIIRLPPMRFRHLPVHDRRQILPKTP
jgi:hypothetical protein